ncbi:MAG: hypothetical protein M3N22_09380 [Acidobacteriota bacterium]|nr:hypothetical protein [Acidobacteriota bacterium]
MPIANFMNISEFGFASLWALCGGSLLRWAKPIAAALNKWSVKPYERFPKLKILPGSRLAGSELNYKASLICFRLCGAIMFISGLYFGAAAVYF